MARQPKRQDKSYKGKEALKRRPKNSGRGSATGSTENSRGELPDERGSASDNDVSWYAENAYLLNDSASIPFSNPAGVSLETQVQTGINPVTTATKRVRVPAVMSIDIVPAVGDAQSATDPINVAARNIFGFIRANQTVSAAYNQVAVMFMILAMTSCYSFYSFCTRAYGLIRTYAQRNRALPEALFFSMGLDYEDFVKNIADFRYWLNTYAEKVGALCIPASMSYIMRQVWLFQNVFLDGPTDKSQLYVYNPVGLFRYNPTGHGSGTDVTPCLDMNPVCEYFQTTHNLMKVQDLIAIGNRLIEPLFLNNIINTISGDILKSYGEDRVWRLLPIPEDYEVTPILNSEVLDQIHNLFIPTKLKVPGSDCVWEHVDANAAISYIKCNYGGDTSTGTTDDAKIQHYFGAQGAFIDFDRMNIQPSEVMVASRLMAFPVADSYTGTGLGGFTRLLCGSEVVVRLRIIRRLANGTGWQQSPISQSFQSAYTGSVLVRPFYKHPLMYYMSDDTLDITADIENYTLVTPDVLRKLHETALLSEFHVPLMGRLIK